MKIRRFAKVAICFALGSFGCPPNDKDDSTSEVSGISTWMVWSSGWSTEETFPKEIPTTTNDDITSGSFDSSTSEVLCGNNILDDGEECDQLNNCYNCLLDRKIFVTSLEFTIDDLLNNQYNDQCNIGASIAGLNNIDSMFVALVVQNNEDMISIPHFEGRYTLTNETNDLFVEKFEDIKFGTIHNAPKYTEVGNEKIVYVWTGFADYNCGNWMSSVGDVTMGQSNSIKNWVYDGEMYPCGRIKGSLYCVEVPLSENEKI